LISTIYIVFNNIQRIGCFYHYVQNIKTNLYRFEKNIEDNHIKNKEILNALSLLPISYEGNEEQLNIELIIKIFPI